MTMELTAMCWYGGQREAFGVFDAGDRNPGRFPDLAAGGVVRCEGGPLNGSWVAPGSTARAWVSKPSGAVYSLAQVPHIPPQGAQGPVGVEWVLRFAG